MRGGYRIVNFKGVALTSGTKGKIAGLFASAQNPHKKRTQLTGLVVGTAAYPDFTAVFMADSGNMSATLDINGDTVAIVIEPDDEVTVTVTTPEVTPEVNPAVNTKKASSK